MTEARYCPEVFNVANTKKAMEIILTPDETKTTEERWETETPYLINLINSKVELNENSIVIDFGVGIGRLARQLIKQKKCSVIGVDISVSMRALGVAHTASDSYVPVSPEMLKLLIANGLRADLVISVWALQHVFNPSYSLALLQSGMKPDAKFFIVNEKHRFVPAKLSDSSGAVWIDDKIDLLQMLRDNLKEIELGKLDPLIVTESTSNRAYWGLYSL